MTDEIRMIEQMRRQIADLVESADCVRGSQSIPEHLFSTDMIICRTHFVD